MQKKHAMFFFFSCLGIFLLHQSAMQWNFSHPLADAYLDDLLCMPICLFPILSGFRFFLGKSYRFPDAYLIGVWAFFSLYFEVILPRINARFTSDPVDMLCYGISMAAFAVMQQPAKTQKIAPLPHESGG